MVGMSHEITFMVSWCIVCSVDLYINNNAGWDDLLTCFLLYLMTMATTWSTPGPCAPFELPSRFFIRDDLDLANLHFGPAICWN